MVMGRESGHTGRAFLFHKIHGKLCLGKERPCHTSRAEAVITVPSSITAFLFVHDAI